MRRIGETRSVPGPESDLASPRRAGTGTKLSRDWKRRLVQILVVLGLLAAAMMLRRRDNLPATPEDTVSAFFDAAGDGDDATYLRLVSGTLRESLESVRSQVGIEAFRADLRRSASGIKGLAVTRKNDIRGDLVGLDVEIVFADRNERQQMLLSKQGNGWAITSIDSALTTKPSKPYGSPVYDE